GVSGSHAILRGPKDIPKKILEEAAGITAYYSQSRKGSFVPVAYALKKYIRKPKGAGPGSVLMEREEVILVEPKLPKGSIDS
ncbi:MAG: fibronectin-binding domain-containing protein, partial [Candidatus Kapaibacteriota bacterium]